jgi:hypothetical protein
LASAKPDKRESVQSHTSHRWPMINTLSLASAEKTDLMHAPRCSWWQHAVWVTMEHLPPML